MHGRNSGPLTAATASRSRWPDASVRRPVAHPRAAPPCRHRPAGRHQPAPGRHQRDRRPPAKDTGHVRRRQRADRMAEHSVGPQAPRLQQPEQRDLDTRTGRLGASGPPEQSARRRIRSRREDDVAQRAVQVWAQPRRTRRRTRPRTPGTSGTAPGPCRVVGRPGPRTGTRSCPRASPCPGHVRRRTRRRRARRGRRPVPPGRPRAAPRGASARRAWWPARSRVGQGRDAGRRPGGRAAVRPARAVPVRARGQQQRHRDDARSAGFGHAVVRGPGRGFSMMTCALVPPMPNEDTAARLGCSCAGHTVCSVSSATVRSDQST